MNRQNILKTAIMLAATLLIAACTNDEMADSQPETLPEGMYPLTFTATQADIVASPQTRVTDSDVDGVHKSKWTDGDQIEVIVKGGDNDTKTTCTLKEDGSIDSKGPQVYWKTTQESTINAWYSNIEPSTTSSTVSLADQSKGLAYVLKAGEVTNAKYNSPNISLNFKHQLAKVRVKLSGDKAPEVNKVCLYTYTSCTNTQGIVSNGTLEGWIEMKGVTYNNTQYYEANVVPGHNIEKFKINDTESMLTTTVTPVAAKLHEIAVDVSGPAKEVQISSITETNYTVQGNIYLKGDGSLHNLKLTLEDGAKLTLDDVTLQPKVTLTDGNENVNAVTCEGNATINLKGTNSITGDYLGFGQGNAILIKSGTLTINGPGSLTATGKGYYGGGICAINNASIVIYGGTITAKGGQGDGNWGNPGIGVLTGIDNTGEDNKCGNITINGGKITATGGPGAAGIGSAIRVTCGDILITGSSTVVKASGGIGAEDIGKGKGEGSKCGTVTLTGGATVNDIPYD